jgi:DNA-binding NarL/FixJ family response regulator
MILNGATNGSVANDLGISERTVEKHVLAAYQRLGARTRTEALLAILD